MLNGPNLAVILIFLGFAMILNGWFVYNMGQGWRINKLILIIILLTYLFDYK